MRLSLSQEFLKVQEIGMLYIYFQAIESWDNYLDHVFKLFPPSGMLAFILFFNDSWDFYQITRHPPPNKSCKYSNKIARFGNIILFLFTHYLQLRMHNIQFSIKSCNLQSLFLSSPILFFSGELIKQDFRVQPFISICTYQKPDLRYVGREHTIFLFTSPKKDSLLQQQGKAVLC